MEQYSLTPPTAEDLTSGDWKARAQASVAVGASTLMASSTAVAALVTDSHVLVRREAIRALAAMGAKNERQTIEAALHDSEETVRVAAVVALGSIGDVDSARAIRVALSANARFMTKDAAVQTLATIGRPALPVVLDALQDPSATLRQVAVRTLGRMATQQDVTTLLNVAGTDTDDQVRYYAIEALRSWPQAAVATFFLQEAAHGPPILQMRAVRGVQSTAGFLSADQRARAVLLLKALFAQYGDRSVRSDADWGWRVISRVLRAFGDEGTRVLEEFRLQRDDLLLARRAYYALYTNQPEGAYGVGSLEEDERLHARFGR
jgi:hypothetical protein